MCMSVCLSVWVFVSEHTGLSQAPYVDLQFINCSVRVSYTGPPLAALQYDMYFRFHR